MAPVPPRIQRRWDELLSQRALLHEEFRRIRSADEFSRKARSGVVEDREQASALERSAELTFALILELSAQVLADRFPDEARELTRLQAQELLQRLAAEKVFPGSQVSILNQLREERNELVHEYAVAIRNAFYFAAQHLESEVDKLIGTLEKRLGEFGYKMGSYSPSCAQEDLRGRSQAT